MHCGTPLYRVDILQLKRASERIQPQIEPKVDERDLFLQQIRTKVRPVSFLYLLLMHYSPFLLFGFSIF